MHLRRPQNVLLFLVFPPKMPSILQHDDRIHGLQRPLGHSQHHRISINKHQAIKIRKKILYSSLDNLCDKNWVVCPYVLYYVGTLEGVVVDIGGYGMRLDLLGRIVYFLSWN